MFICCTSKKQKKQTPIVIDTPVKSPTPTPEAQSDENHGKLSCDDEHSKIKGEIDQAVSVRTNRSIYLHDDISFSVTSTKIMAIPITSLEGVRSFASKLISARQDPAIIKESITSEKEYVSKLIYNKSKQKTHYLEYKWAIKYTEYLNHKQSRMEQIDNTSLLIEQLRTTQGPILVSQTSMRNVLQPLLEKDTDYVLINENAWTFIIAMYGGGPEIRLDEPQRKKITESYIHQKILPDQEGLEDDGVLKQFHTQTSQCVSSPDQMQVGNWDFPVFGLRNPKFQCYMNSVLQCLLSLSTFNQFFLQNTFPKRKRLCHAYSELLKKVKHTQNGSIVTAQSLFSLFYKKFSCWEQHDSQEFFLFFLGQMSDELQNEQQELPDIVADLFRGEITSSILCKSCKQPQISPENFYDLSLPMEKSFLSRHMTIGDSLKSYFQGEEIEDSWTCGQCNTGQKKVKKTLHISCLPKILTIHLKRFTHFPKKLKIKDPVVFRPVLDISEYCENAKAIYSLRGIIFHSGVIDSGHYTAATCRSTRERKSDTNNQFEPSTHKLQWFLFDDEETAQIPTQHLLKLDQAYQLVYELNC